MPLLLAAPGLLNLRIRQTRRVLPAATGAGHPRRLGGHVSAGRSANNVPTGRLTRSFVLHAASPSSADEGANVKAGIIEGELQMLGDNEDSESGRPNNSFWSWVASVSTTSDLVRLVLAVCITFIALTKLADWRVALEGVELAFTQGVTNSVKLLSDVVEWVVNDPWRAEEVWVIAVWAIALRPALHILHAVFSAIHVATHTAIFTPNGPKLQAHEDRTPFEESFLGAIHTPLRGLTVVFLVLYSVTQGTYFLEAAGQLSREPATGFMVSFARVMYICWFSFTLSFLKSRYLEAIVDAVAHYRKGSSEAQAAKPLVAALDNLASLVIYAVTIVWVLHSLNLRAQSLGVAGVSSLAVALASKDVVSNFLGGAVVLLFRPFKIGDTVRLKELKGKIMSIGWYNTIIRDDDSYHVAVPNSTFIMGGLIRNEAKATHRRLVHEFAVRSEDLGVVPQIVEGVLRRMKSSPMVDETLLPVRFAAMIRVEAQTVVPPKSSGSTRLYEFQQHVLLLVHDEMLLRGARYGHALGLDDEHFIPA